MKNCFDILGLSVNATERELKQARRRLCAKYHPDQGGDAEKFNTVNRAYEEAMMYKSGKKSFTDFASTKMKSCVRHKNLFDFY